MEIAKAVGVTYEQAFCAEQYEKIEIRSTQENH